MNKEGCCWPRIQIHHHSRSNHQYLMFAILFDKERGSILPFKNVTFFKNIEFWVEREGEVAALATVPQSLCGSLILLV